MAGSSTDPNFENVTLLLHGDGTNGGQNNTFVDGSTNNFTITRNGNTTQGTFSPYGDNWSNYFDGTGDYLTAPNNAAFQFGTGNVTIESWIYISGNSAANPEGNRVASICSGIAPTSVNTDFWWVVKGNTATTGTGVQLRVWNSGVGANVIDLNFTISQNTWHHIAFVRSGNTAEVFFNGTSQGTSSFSGTITAGTNPLLVGYSQTGTSGNYNHALNGYLSNLRILKGTAQYTAAFTPPTSPLTAITNTSLLTCQSNRFRDASTNNFTITRNGDVSVQRFSPFSPTAAYAAGTIGGSGYFDGTDDYLAVADNSNLRPGAGAFTIEAWIYRNASGAAHTIYAKGGASTGIVFQVTSGNVLRFTHTTTNIDSTGTIVGSSWNHVAIVREGTGTNQTKLYINGVQDGQGTVSTDFTQTEEVRVGTNRGATEDLNGYLSDVRFVKGTAVYTATFTPPSSPLSAITDTQFLCVFQNAAILDNAMMAVPETVGNAQIDTTTKKYGTGSMKFDGTGDYLSVPNNVAFNFGTGDFTIEAWVYIAGNSSLNNSSTRDAGIIVSFPTSIQTLTNVWGLRISGSGTTTGTGISFSNWQSGSQSLLSATVTVSQSAWNHIAVARSGTTTKLFLNGTEVASGTLSNQTVNSGHNLAIGRTGYPGYIEEMNGFIDDLRITKGVARYTANFTAPTAAFPDL